MEPIFTAAGCNAEINVVDVSPEGILAYASGDTVLQVNIQTSKEKKGRLLAHVLPLSSITNTVADAAVHVVRVASLSGTIVAGSAGGRISCWCRGNTAEPVSYAHGKAINTLCLWEDPETEGTPANSDDIRIRLTVIFADVDGGLHQIYTTLRGKGKGYDASPFIHETAFSFSPKKVISLTTVRLAHIDGLVTLLGATDNALSILFNLQPMLSLPGHSNWINSLDYHVLGRDQTQLRIISGAADRVIRVWKLAPVIRKHSSANDVDDLQELVPPKKCFLLGDTEYSVECESILYGHEGTIHSVRWDYHREMISEPKNLSVLPSPSCFWSAAADHTIIRWQETPDQSGWVSALQIGDISSLGTVGGDRSFGFYSAIPVRGTRTEVGGALGVDSEDYRIIAHGSTGSIIQYELAERHSPQSNTVTVKKNAILASGHTSEVVSCSWEPGQGRFLATASKDMTSRIWNLRHPMGELARPQIHGYELKTIVVLGSDQLISAADEKILRSFSAPSSFLQRLWDQKDGLGGKEEDGVSVPTLDSSLPSSSPLRTSVFVPALGLSNREGSIETAFEAGPEESPTEYDLSRLSLWRETDKLYGHGLELQTLAVTQDGRLAASSSRATSTEDAQIRFWKRRRSSEDGWKALPACTFRAHGLTVVSMAFSPNDRYLLAVSRDRHFSLAAISRKAGDGEEEIKVHLVTLREAHSRIIWCAAWGASGTFFVTGSRDRWLRTWRLIDEETSLVTVEMASEVEFSTAITAVAIRGDRWLAVGTEEGQVWLLIQEDDESLSWHQKGGIQIGPMTPITDLKWHPREPMLAVTSSTLVQVLKVDL